MESTRQKTATRVAPVLPAATAISAGSPHGGISPRVQLQARVSSPRDPAEKEAEQTAKTIMRMAMPDSAIGYVRTPQGGVFRNIKEKENDEKVSRQWQSPYIQRFADSGIFAKTLREDREPIHRKPKADKEEKEDTQTIQRKANTRDEERDRVQRQAEGRPNLKSNVMMDIQNSLSSGSPLPLSVRRFMEPRFRADFSQVRIHASEKSAQLNRQVSAQAFTMGNHIFFGKDRFRPDSDEGRELIAHELTHTIQQGASVQRHAEASVTQQVQPHVQRGIISDALDYFADKANNIPGYAMLTFILGVNPINMRRVERNALNLFRAIIGFLPGGELIFQALQRHGILDRVGAWLQQQIATLGVGLGMFRDALDRFLDSLGWTDVFDLGDVWNRAKRIFTEPIDRIIRFIRGLVRDIIKFIKDAILRPVARLAEGTRAYDLLRLVLGEDPITGDPYPRTPENLIGGFMRLIGQEEKWRHLQESRAIPRAWAWFQEQMGTLFGFVRQIPQLFVRMWEMLQINDLLDIPGAFRRVVGVFAGFVGSFVSWAGRAALQIMEFIFEVLAPGAMAILRRGAAVFRTIISNPIRFVANLVRAGVLGFRQFAANILTHLINGLVGWLTGALAGAGLQLPERWDLRGVLSLVLQILGLTWQNIRQKLVRVMGERVVAALETTFDFVVTLIREGPAAAWRQIVEFVGNLRDMVLGQIRDWVVQTVVVQAVMRIATMLNPAGAVIQAIIAIYNTIMFFRERLRQIMEVAQAFFNSIAQIASGAIGAAANYVEQTMARLVPVVISFLARLLGLGGISNTIRNIIMRIRAPIDRALDRLVDWIRDRARAILSRLLGGDPTAPPQERLQRGLQEAVSTVNRYAGQAIGRLVLQPLLAAIRRRHQLASLEAVPDQGVWRIDAMVNPSGRAATSARVASDDAREWPTGSSRDPIPIKWFKPHSGLYPTLRIGRTGAERTPRQGIRLPEIARTPERLLQVSAENFISRETRLSRQSRGSENRKEQIRSHLEKLRTLPTNDDRKAYCRDFSSYAIDHVRDLTWRGADDYDNLWPLDSGKNNAINASHNQRVRVRDGNDVVTKAASQFPDKHFIVKAVASSVPSSAGDHGTDDSNPINSGRGGVPKRAT